MITSFLEGMNHNKRLKQSINHNDSDDDDSVLSVQQQQSNTNKPTTAAAVTPFQVIHRSSNNNNNDNMIYSDTNENIQQQKQPVQKQIYTTTNIKNFTNQLQPKQQQQNNITSNNNRVSLSPISSSLYTTLEKSSTLQTDSTITSSNHVYQNNESTKENHYYYRDKQEPPANVVETNKTTYQSVVQVVRDKQQQFFRFITNVVNVIQHYYYTIETKWYYELLDHSPILVRFIYMLSLLFICQYFIGLLYSSSFLVRSLITTPNSHTIHRPDYIIPPKHYTRQQDNAFWERYNSKCIKKADNNNNNNNTNPLMMSYLNKEGQDRPLTLRDVLMDDQRGYHLAMAPAFFGFYGYLGVLDAWVDNVYQSNTTLLYEHIQSVAGASAGAMIAVFIASEIQSIQLCIEFVSTITLSDFADFPGIFAIFRGNLFEYTMYQLLQRTSTRIIENPLLQLQNTRIPIAITAFDIQTMNGYTLRTGSMARAARASATFPFLFQPVGWKDNNNYNDEYILIDGGIMDNHGIVGLNDTLKMFYNKNVLPQRVINLVIGSFSSIPPPGPAQLLNHPDMISISIQNLPQPGPWNMLNGPKAIIAAKNAMIASLDIPLYPMNYNDKENNNNNHYELHIDTSKFL